MPRRVWAWAAYDWANSAFSTTVMAGFFPIFFKTYWSAGQAPETSTLHLGLVNGLTSALLLGVAPIVGGIVDTGHRKKAGLAMATAIAAGATGALALVAPGAWLTALTLFGIALIGFFTAVVCYDSLLVDVCPPRDYARVSAFGYALGYLGGGVLLVINVAMTWAPHWFGLADRAAAIRWSFVSVAAWWLVFSLPLIFVVKQPASAAAPGLITSAADSCRRLATTARAVMTQRDVALFLVAYFLYIDGVHTIIRMAVDFGLNLGFGAEHLIFALLLVQFVAAPAALLFGWLGTRWRIRSAIHAGLAVYIAISVWGYFLSAVWQFYVMAAAIGSVQGGVQSLSRALFARLIPNAESGRYFGVYNMLGKFSAIIGPVLVGVTAAATANPRLSILSIVILFIAGAAVLGRVAEPAD